MSWQPVTRPITFPFFPSAASPLRWCLLLFASVQLSRPRGLDSHPLHGRRTLGGNSRAGNPYQRNLTVIKCLFMTPAVAVTRCATEFIDRGIRENGDECDVTMVGWSVGSAVYAPRMSERVVLQPGQGTITGNSCVPLPTNQPSSRPST